MAIPAFTTYTLESTRAICEAGADAGMPVIVQAGSSSFAAVGRSMLAATALAMAKESPPPVGVHLDHATDLTEIRACIELGYSSVMIDGSHRSFEKNVEVTQPGRSRGARARSLGGSGARCHRRRGERLRTRPLRPS